MFMPGFLVLTAGPYGMSSPSFGSFLETSMLVSVIKKKKEAGCLQEGLVMISNSPWILVIFLTLTLKGHYTLGVI